MKNIKHWVWIVLIISPIIFSCKSSSSHSWGGSSRKTINIDGDLIVDDKYREYEEKEINVKGDVIVRNSGVLVLDDSELNILSRYDEEHMIEITGDSTFRAIDSTIQGDDYQYAIVAMEDDGESPFLYFDQSIVTFHMGIQAFDETVVESYYSDIEEIQVHDEAEVTITGGIGIYPVFFFEDDEDLEISGLEIDRSVSRTIHVSGGWTFELRHAIVDGYQIDVFGNAEIRLKDCEGITASIHTPGNLGGGTVTVNDVTTSGRDDGSYLGLGPEIIYENTDIELFNIYVNGTDDVRIIGGVVNEANTLGSSKLFIDHCTINYNLVQAYDSSELTIDDSGIDSDSSYIPSVTAYDNSLIIIRDSNCRNLQAQAIDNAEIRFENVTNLDEDDLSTRGDGKILIDGVEI